ncbi:MAG TPA: hypothetical protein IGS37_15375 [Synechococcales cyanobacterium M55_K2018_004]|nr:hypothetical protein [Synechococcales cyanobacterium M55_K2018_004]
MLSSNEYIQLPSTEVTGDALIAICEAADVIACECPGYLARLLRQVQNFRSYTLRCIDQFPEDAETHYWLSDRATEVANLLTQTMLELMKKEGLIDDSNRILLNKMSERARATALKQIGS